MHSAELSLQQAQQIGVRTAQSRAFLRRQKAEVVFMRDALELLQERSFARVRERIQACASVVAMTCSGASMRDAALMKQFNTVIIEEAGKVWHDLWQAWAMCNVATC
jgi:hypothetical protein